MARVTVKYLITEGLGYCCQWSFFTLYVQMNMLPKDRETALIATRLGVTTRAVRKAKEAFGEGCFSCEGKEKCLSKFISARIAQREKLQD